MFRWLPIVWANLKRRKLRLVFTFISILLAFLMFGMLDAMRTSLSPASSTWPGPIGCSMKSKINMTVPLPRAHYEKIRATTGVEWLQRHSTGSAACTRTPSGPSRCRPRNPSSS